MDRAGTRRPPSRNGSRGGALKGALIRTAAWVVAVPLLCATVIVGGAVPLYLLLPDAKPEMQGPQPQQGKPVKLASAVAKPAAPPKAAPSHPASPDAEPSAAPPEAVSDEPPADAAAAEPVAEPAPDAAVPDEAADAPAPEEAEPQVAAVVPTPRPEPPAPQLAAVAPPAPSARFTADPAANRRTASLETPDAAPPARTPPDTSGPNTGRRDTILRTVTLRAGPGGRNVGTLRSGTPVVIGRCDEWCEVRAGGTVGWVHPSFLTGSGAAQREGAPVAARQVERRRPPVVRERDEDWLDEGLAYGRRDAPVMIEPQWAGRGEGRPRPLRRAAPPQRYYDPYDDDLDY